MTCRVVIVPEADEQLQSIDAWWTANRPAAPDLFLDEFQHASDLLAAVPEIGSRFRHARHPGIRRVLLQRSRYWVYYVYDRQRAIVYILAIWSSFRGSEPPLPLPKG